MRDTREDDLDQCLALAPDRFLHDPGRALVVRNMWSYIINSGAGEAGVLVCPQRPSELLFFGFSVFVTDECAARYHKLQHPAIEIRMAEEFDAGGHPFLTLPEISRANAAAGLNLVVTQYGFIAPASDDGLGDQLRYATYESFRKHHAGLHFRSFTNEVFDRSSREMGAGWGFRIGRYTQEQLQAAGIPSDRAPCVWMATRKDALGNPGAVFPNMLFSTFAPPRFGLSLRQQELLKLALEEHTDEWIAEALGASIATIKKQLRSVYDKVRDANIEASPSLRLGESTNGVRGAEIRRYLLKYLREHPEELHPYNAAVLSGAVPNNL
jgi:DNA-binding CsgD family transcriptional regulator